MYSSRVVIIRDNMKIKKGFSLNGPRSKIINNAPKPYIGQYGPDKNPLFVQLPCTILQNITSHIQPITL